MREPAAAVVGEGPHRRDSANAAEARGRDHLLCGVVGVADNGWRCGFAAVPQPLIDQLAVGGRLVIPVGKDGDQDLRVVTRSKDGTTSETLFPVRFVPMTGEAQATQPHR